MNTKQTFVVRKDLNMRTGKIAAQVAHASMAFLTRNCNLNSKGEFQTRIKNPIVVKDWFDNSFTKICLQCANEEELLKLYNEAKDAGLVVHLVTDSGLTEFHGIPTNTCIGIGPDESDKIDQVTKHLKLL